MRIYNNPAAFNTWRQLQITDLALSKNLEKLSSGLRINRAADDASGLATSEKMRNQIAGLKQASSNAQDGISLIQSADGALDVVSELLRRVRTLAVKGNSDTNTAEERYYIANEIDQLFYELNAIVGEEAEVEEFDGIDYENRNGRAEFNTRALFQEAGGLLGRVAMEDLQFQIGANINQTMVLSRTNIEGEGLLYQLRELAAGRGNEGALEGIFDGNFSAEMALWNPGLDNDDGIFGTNENPIGDTNTDSPDAFRLLIEGMDVAVATVNSLRATLGAYQNRLEYTVRNLNTITENTLIAESRVRDTDMVDEMASFTRNNILLQSGTAMMAQANAKPQTVLRLLG
ncbi:MAG: flagellin [Symbiobacteriaceae bacterium]|nr:flagellin [Symbiobacteriaceae bacterium]